MTTRVEEGADLVAVVANRLAHLRTERELSLEALARISGVSRAMLWQIEQGRSVPTIKVLARIASAVGVSVVSLLQGGERGRVELLRASETKRLSSDDGRHVSRALFPFSGLHSVEFYELLLAPGAVESAEAHLPGTTENLVLHEGRVEIDIAEATCVLAPGDALYFQADVPHCYRNIGDVGARIYLVMHWPTRLNHG